MDDIVIEQVYAYPIEQVWEALTDPAALAEWLMPGDFRPVVGHRVRLRCEPRPDFDGVVDVEVLQVEKPRLLAYSWKTTDMSSATTVTYTLTALPGGSTRLRLVHAGFTGEGGRKALRLFKDGWGHKLGDLFPRALAARRKGTEETPMGPTGNAIESNKAIVREFTRVFKNQHNVDGIDHLFAPDFRHHFPPPLGPGLAGLKDIGRMMNTAFPDVVVTEDDLIAAEDKVIERSSAAATHRASLLGEKPTNNRVTWTEIHIYRIRDGKIAEHWVEFSRLELFKQIGALQSV